MARVRLEEKPKPRIVLCVDGGGALGTADLMHRAIMAEIDKQHLEEDRKLFAEIKDGKHPTYFSVGSKGSACSS